MPNDDRCFPGRQPFQIPGFGEKLEEWIVDSIVTHHRKGLDSEFQVLWKVGDKTWAQHHEVAHLNVLGQYCELMGVKDAAGLPSNYVTEELEGEEDNIIQVQACAMVKDKRMKGILKDFPFPSSSTANYSPLLTSPISSMTMNRQSNQEIKDCMKYELCLWAAERGMPVNTQIPQPIQWSKYINANNHTPNNRNKSWSNQQHFPTPPVYPHSSPYLFCKQSTRKYHEVASEFLISLCNPTVGCNSYEKLCNGHIGRLQYFS